MKDDNLRKAIGKFMAEREQTAILLDDHCYDKSIIGVTAGGNVVYDYAKMIDEFAEDEGCSYDEAQEWVDYNTMRAMPYINSFAERDGSIAPIIIEVGREELSAYE